MSWVCQVSWTEKLLVKELPNDEESVDEKLPAGWGWVLYSTESIGIDPAQRGGAFANPGWWRSPFGSLRRVLLLRTSGSSWGLVLVAGCELAT
jgi:hypothetical protein